MCIYVKHVITHRVFIKSERQSICFELRRTQYCFNMISCILFKQMHAYVYVNFQNNVSIKNNIPKTLNIDQENNTHNTNIQATNNDQQTDTTIQVLEPGLSNPTRIPPPESTRQLLEQRCSSISDRISIHDAQSGECRFSFTC
jgi:hypothetical protein